MTDFRHVTDDFTAAPQISVADVAEAARLGFKAIICNRPDDEEPGQPSAAEIGAAAAAAGLAYTHIPVRGAPGPAEVEAMWALHRAGQFTDLTREAFPQDQKLASWWSYRAQDFRQSNRGLRLDHILVSPGLRDAAFVDGKAQSRIHDDVREWERPSDHAPVSADLNL